jgi:guanylate kinase
VRSAPGAVCFPLVLAGPSGAGKTTVARALVAGRDDLRFSVSATTRPPREGETDGVDYHFLDRAEFERRRDAGELLEWAEVHGRLYGTPRFELDAARREGRHLLLDIDVQGARSVRRVAPQAVTVFILPPSGTRVVERLRGRGSEGEEALRARLAGARAELDALEEFDYAVVNDALEETVGAVEAVLAAEEHRVDRLGERVLRRARELQDEIRRSMP